MMNQIALEWSQGKKPPLASEDWLYSKIAPDTLAMDPVTHEAEG